MNLSASSGGRDWISARQNSTGLTPRSGAVAGAGPGNNEKPIVRLDVSHDSWLPLLASNIATRTSPNASSIGTPGILAALINVAVNGRFAPGVPGAAE